MSEADQELITKSRLISDLAELGVQPGQLVMLHASVKAIGWIVGGPDVVLQALLDLLTPTGTYDGDQLGRLSV
jgi:aminoglycoside 3-N-acetyltransferase